MFISRQINDRYDNLILLTWTFLRIVRLTVMSQSHQLVCDYTAEMERAFRILITSLGRGDSKWGTTTMTLNDDVLCPHSSVPKIVFSSVHLMIWCIIDLWSNPNHFQSICLFATTAAAVSGGAEVTKEVDHLLRWIDRCSPPPVTAYLIGFTIFTIPLWRS